MLYRGDDSGRYRRKIGIYLKMFTASHSRRLRYKLANFLVYARGGSCVEMQRVMDSLLMLRTINELMWDTSSLIVGIGRKKYMMRNFSNAI